MSTQSFVWDKLVRSTHWLVAAIIVCNSFIVEPGETLHQFLGYCAVSFVTLRIVWSLTWAEKPARFSDLIPTIKGLRTHWQEIITRQETAAHGHNAFGLLAIWAMWLCIFGLAFTGYTAENTDWGIMNDLDDWHEGLVIVLQTIIVLHVIAVYLTGKWFKRNLIKTMVHK